VTSELTTSGRRYADQSAEERHDERRKRLLEAALDAFGTAGYSETSIGELCARARVSTRNFYEHFAGRQEVLIALHDEINADALMAVATAIAAVDPDDLPARARAGVAAYLREMTADRRRARIALVESVGLSRETESHRQAAISRFAGLIELESNRLAAAGVVTARDFRLVSVALVGAINGLVSTWTSAGDWNEEEVVDVAVDLIVSAIGA
jgi:AcrR family transcriptional regulator